MRNSVSPNIQTNVQADSSKKIMEFQNLKNDIEGITLGDPVATTIDQSKVGIKKMLDGKINYNSKFNR
jgi:hypothetical protein